MKVTSVRFAMLRVTKKFENDRAECEIEVGPKDKVEDAYALAIKHCMLALDLSEQSAAALRAQSLLDIVATPTGREAFERFIEVENRRLGRY